MPQLRLLASTKLIITYGGLLLAAAKLPCFKHDVRGLAACNTACNIRPADVLLRPLIRPSGNQHVLQGRLSYSLSGSRKERHTTCCDSHSVDAQLHVFFAQEQLLAADMLLGSNDKTLFDQLLHTAAG